MLTPWGTELIRTDSGSLETNEEGAFALSVSTDVVSQPAREQAVVANADEYEEQGQEGEHQEVQGSDADMARQEQEEEHRYDLADF